MPVPTTPQPDLEFNFSIVEAIVDNVSFRLPDYIFNASTVLKERFSQSRSKEGTAELSFGLGDATAPEFRDFLRCLLPEAGFPRSDDPKTWANILKLATLWKFDDVRWSAINTIHQMDDPALKLALARRYDVKEFLPDAMKDIAELETLEKEDYEVLGIELAMKVVRYREKCIEHERVEPLNNKPTKNGIWIDTSARDEYRKRLVEEIFGKAFAKDVEEGQMLDAPSRPSTPPPRRRRRRGER